jgi:hypothetical protein
MPENQRNSCNNLTDEIVQLIGRKAKELYDADTSPDHTDFI